MTRTMAVLAVVVAAPVAAQNLDEARSRFKRGTELYDEGNYRGALVEFQRAFEAAPSFKLLYNIGLVHLQLQDYARAVQSFTRYLSEGGADVPAARRDEVLREIDRLTPRIGKLTVETNPGAEVLLDDESVGFAPLPGPVPANTGRHKVAVVLQGHETTRVVDIAGQQTLTVVLSVEGVAAGPASAPAAAVTGAAGPSSSGGGSRAPAVVMWVVTGASAIAALTLMGLAVSASGELRQTREAFGVSRLTLDQAASKSLNFSIAADVMTGVAVVAGVVALWVTIASASPAKVALGLGPTGVTVRGGF